MKSRLIILAILAILVAIKFLYQPQKSTQPESQKTQHTQQKNRANESETTELPASKNNNIPQKVYNVLQYIRQYDDAPDGYVGGRKFGNFEKHLPQKGSDGKRINYREWDVNPKREGKNRGAQRLITGDDGSAYYTADHYDTFTKIE
ncbi:MAG: hypothetical protein KA974_07765 [Saprospiraceae bacterium]|nr:hypothetical protein [Saprospiraceae bacterium]